MADVRVSSVAVLLLVAASVARADLLHVPADHPTIQDAIVQAVDGDVILVASGDYDEQIDYLGKGIAIRAEDGAEVTSVLRVECMSGEPPEASLEGFRIRGAPDSNGRGVEIQGSSLTITGCLFADIHVENPGAAIFCQNAERFTLVDCTVRDVSGAHAPVFMSNSFVDVRNCDFIESTVGGGGGGLAGGNITGTFVNCRFLANQADFLGGALFFSLASDVTMVNCVFSGNGSARGTIYTNSMVDLIHCTISANTGSGIMHTHGAEVFISHCVIWDNTDGSITHDPAFPPGNVTVEHSSIEDGYPGTGVTEGDPLHVQPGAHDLRLGLASICVDAGAAGSLPPDQWDLDDDGDTTEPLPIDAAGQPRMAGGATDFGAHEGAYVQLPPAATDQDIDEGEAVFLVPGGGQYTPGEDVLVLMTNVSGGNDATVCIEMLGDDPHPDAGGFGPVGDGLHVETSLPDGTHFTTMLLPVSAGDIGAASPYDLQLVHFDETSGDWTLAVAGNVQDSPGHDGPVGDRIEVGGPGPFGVTLEVGDHGVYWDPSSGAGLVWANVDHATDFAPALAAACAADVDGDAVVNAFDLVAVLLAWGTADPAADVNGDGVVNVTDLVEVIMAWGAC